MERDPVDDILGYLGLGPLPADAQGQEHASLETTAPTVDESGARLLAQASKASLWLTGNENADWVELRGEFPTLRVTQTKARLLLASKGEVTRWAAGEKVEVRSKETQMQVCVRFALAQLEIRHKNWKPLRLSRDQAQALAGFWDSLRTFTGAA